MLPISLWCKYAMANNFCGIVFNFKYGNKIKYIQILNTVVVSNKQHVAVLFFFTAVWKCVYDRRP